MTKKVDYYRLECDNNVIATRADKILIANKLQYKFYFTITLKQITRKTDNGVIATRTMP